MDRIKVKIINKSHHPLPSYGTFEAAGMDVRAYLPEGAVTLKPRQRALIPTGYTYSSRKDMSARYARAPDLRSITGCQ